MFCVQNLGNVIHRQWIIFYIAFRLGKPRRPFGRVSHVRNGQENGACRPAAASLATSGRQEARYCSNRASAAGIFKRLALMRKWSPG